MDDRNFENFGDDEEPMVSYEEVEAICQRHIDEGNPAYTEDEFTRIYEWMEETRFNETLMTMVLDGKLDVIIHDDELAFALTEKAKGEVEAMGIIPPPDPNSKSLLGNIKFTDEEEKE